MKQMISTTPRKASKPQPAIGAIQVQQRTAVAKPTRTCVIRIESSCLMWKRRYAELSELFASSAMMMPIKLRA